MAWFVLNCPPFCLLAVHWFSAPVPYLSGKFFVMPFKIVKRKLSTLKPNDKNPRSIKDAKFQKLVANLQTYPRLLEIRPIVVDAEGKILGGNMRFRAAQHLGWKEISTINAEDLTPEEMQAFIILDNQDFGEWDFNVLANEFNPDQLVQLGFEPSELGISLDEPKFIAGDNSEVEIGNEEEFDTSHVKMVQLFLNTSNHPEFMAQIEELQKHFQTDNLTDTVLKAVEYAHTHCGEKV